MGFGKLLSQHLTNILNFSGNIALLGDLALSKDRGPCHFRDFPFRDLAQMGNLSISGAQPSRRPYPY